MRAPRPPVGSIGPLALAAILLAFTRLVLFAQNPGPLLCPTPGNGTPAAPHQVWAYEGLLGTNIIDASVVTLSDATYRMYYAGFGEYPINGSARDPYIASAVSSDGLHWDVEGRVGLAGGWPRVIALPDRRLRMYYGNGGAITAALSSDGLQWRREELSGLPTPESRTSEYSGVGVVSIGDGYRLYFSRKRPSEKYPMTGETSIYSAISKDGLDWQPEPGLRIDNARLDDEPAVNHPDVIRLPDGTWQMFFWTTSSRVWTARSTDGLEWDVRPEEMFGADPGVVALSDGRLRVYLNHLDTDGSLGAERQKFWSYRADQACYSLDAPLRVRLDSPSTAVTLRVLGSSTTDLAMSAELWWNGTQQPSESRPDVVMETRSGTPPFEATIRVYPRAASRGSGVLLISADDGTRRTHKVVSLSSAPALPPAPLSAR